MLVEVYEDQAAFDSHLETSHVKAFLADVGSLVEGELVVYEATAAPFSEGPKGVLG
jgi:quinol monooxygenase YgiN